MEVCGQHETLVALRPGKNITRWKGGWVEPGAWMNRLAQRNTSCPCWDLNPVSPSSWRRRFSQVFLQFIMKIVASLCKHSTLSDCAILYTHYTTVSSRYPLRQYNICCDITKSHKKFISSLYMFRAHVIIVRRAKLYYKDSGIITLKQVSGLKLLK